MTKYEFLPKLDIIYLELGKHFYIYATCFALSSVNLCRIPYESLVMLFNSRSRTHSNSYVHYSHTRSKNQESPYRITLIFNVLSSCYCLLNHLLYSKDTCGYAKKYKRRKGSKRWRSVPIIKTIGTRCPPPLIKKRRR